MKNLGYDKITRARIEYVSERLEVNVKKAKKYGLLATDLDPRANQMRYAQIHYVELPLNWTATMRLFRAVAMVYKRTDKTTSSSAAPTAAETDRQTDRQCTGRDSMLHVKLRNGACHFTSN
jgi:hypothetical protein